MTKPRQRPTKKVLSSPFEVKPAPESKPDFIITPRRKTIALPFKSENESKPRGPIQRPSKKILTSPFEVKPEKNESPEPLVRPRRKTIQSPFKPQEEKPRGPTQRPSKKILTSPFEVKAEEEKTKSPTQRPTKKILTSPFEVKPEPEKNKSPTQRPTKKILTSPFEVKPEPEKTKSPTQRPTKKILTSPFEVKPEPNVHPPLQRPTKKQFPKPSVNSATTAVPEVTRKMSTDSNVTAKSESEPVPNAEPADSEQVTNDKVQQQPDDDHKENPELQAIQSQLSKAMETFTSLRQENASLKTQIEAEETNGLGLKEREKTLEAEDKKLLMDEHQRVQRIASLKERLETLQEAQTLRSDKAPKDSNWNHPSNTMESEKIDEAQRAKEIKERDTIIEDLKAKMQENRDEIENVSKSRDEQIKKRRQENEAVRLEMEECKTKMEKLRDQIAAEKERADKLEQRLKERKEIESGDGDEAAKQHMTELMGKLEALEKDKDEKLKEIQASLDVVEGDLSENGDNIKTLKAMNGELNERNGSLMMQCAELKEKKKEMEQMMSQIQQMEADNEALRTEKKDGDGNDNNKISNDVHGDDKADGNGNDIGDKTTDANVATVAVENTETNEPTEVTPHPTDVQDEQQSVNVETVEQTEVAGDTVADDTKNEKDNVNGAKDTEQDAEIPVSDEAKEPKEATADPTDHPDANGDEENVNMDNVETKEQEVDSENETDDILKGRPGETDDVFLEYDGRDHRTSLVRPSGSLSVTKLDAPEDTEVANPSDEMDSATPDKPVTEARETDDAAQRGVVSDGDPDDNAPDIAE